MPYSIASIKYEFRPFRIAGKRHRWSLWFEPDTKLWHPTLYWNPVDGGHGKIKAIDKDLFKTADVFRTGGLGMIEVILKRQGDEACGKTLLKREVDGGRYWDE